MLRSRHFFGWLRLRMSVILELTPAPTKLGRLRLQAKKWLLRLHTLKFVILSCYKSTLLMQVFYWIIFTSYKFISLTRTRLSFFACQTDATGGGASLKRWLLLSAPANKKSNPAPHYKWQLQAAPAPQH